MTDRTEQVVPVHFSSLDNMRRCLKNHVVADPVLGTREPLRVLDVGGADVNGSYRSLFNMPNCSYVAADIDAGPGVDVVLSDPEVLPFEDSAFDVVVSGNTFEHAPTFWRLFAEMVRVCADDGVVVVLVPSAGAIHRYPVDCYRFLPDSFQALADGAGVRLAECWQDDRGPFHELVGVFAKHDREMNTELTAGYVSHVDGELQNSRPFDDDPEVEVTGGVKPTYKMLKLMHRELEPRFYSEIGVEYGRSLAFAECPAIGIDPAPELKTELPPTAILARCLSQDFFTSPSAVAQMGPLDLAYIDGMHLLENALLDFMYMERHAHAASVILVDDIFPNHPTQALRQRVSRYWTGDVWKIINVFRVLRPDLVLIPLDTIPSGTLMVIGADPTNDVLWRGFDALVSAEIERTEVPGWILQRRPALHPDDPLVTRVLRMMRAARDADDVPAAVQRVRELVAGALPRKVAGPR